MDAWFPHLASFNAGTSHSPIFPFHPIKNTSLVRQYGWFGTTYSCGAPAFRSFGELPVANEKKKGSQQFLQHLLKEITLKKFTWTAWQSRESGEIMCSRCKGCTLGGWETPSEAPHLDQADSWVTSGLGSWSHHCVPVGSLSTFKPHTTQWYGPGTMTGVGDGLTAAGLFAVDAQYLLGISRHKPTNMELSPTFGIQGTISNLQRFCLRGGGFYIWLDSANIACCNLP